MNSHTEWIKKAEADLDVAETLFKLGEQHKEIVCFHCQQAVEKYFKAFLDNKNIKFPRTHDLDLLLKMCIDIDTGFNQLDRTTIAVLTDFAVNFRYPGEYEEIDSTEIAQYLQVAREVKKLIIDKL